CRGLAVIGILSSLLQQLASGRRRKAGHPAGVRHAHRAMPDDDRIGRHRRCAARPVRMGPVARKRRPRDQGTMTMAPVVARASADSWARATSENGKRAPILARMTPLEYASNTIFAFSRNTFTSAL